MHILFIFFPHIGYYRVLSRVPCAIQYVLISYLFYICCAVLIAQSCLTLCNSKDYSPPGSSVHGILQARILERVAMPSSSQSSQPRHRTQVSHMAGGFFTFWATREAQEYWRGWPISSPGELPHPGIKLGSPALQVDSLPAKPPGKPILYILVQIQYIHRSKEKQEDVKQNAAFLVAAL